VVPNKPRIDLKLKPNRDTVGKAAKTQTQWLVLKSLYLSISIKL